MAGKGKNERGRDKGVKIKEGERWWIGRGRRPAGGSKSLSGRGTRRGLCPDLWPPAAIREWIGPFSITLFTVLYCLQPVSEQPWCCYMMIYILYDLLQYADWCNPVWFTVDMLLSYVGQWLLFGPCRPGDANCIKPLSAAMEIKKKTWAGSSFFFFFLELQTDRQTDFKCLHVQKNIFGGAGKAKGLS